jgi:hypothetical protein
LLQKRGSTDTPGFPWRGVYVLASRLAAKRTKKQLINWLMIIDVL